MAKATKTKPSHKNYCHPTGCYTLEKLFKKQMVEAVSRRVEYGHAIFTLHEHFSSRYSIENQHGGRWKLTDKDEIVKAIELAKRYKKVRLVRG